MCRRFFCKQKLSDFQGTDMVIWKIQISIVFFANQKRLTLR